VLRTRVVDPNVVLEPGRIKLKQPLRFRGATGDLLPASQKILDGVATMLDEHREIQHLRIEAHWDRSLGEPRAKALTQQQAEAVRRYLVSRGIPEGRIEAVGQGASRPLVPSITPANRARNRRVELKLD
jgi:OOP family OmpA-OmpF porin